MVEYLRKIYDFFKTNAIAKDLFLGSIGAAVGVFVVNILVKRRNDWLRNRIKNYSWNPCPDWKSVSNSSELKTLANSENSTYEVVGGIYP